MLVKEAEASDIHASHVTRKPSLKRGGGGGFYTFPWKPCGSAESGAPNRTRKNLLRWLIARAAAGVAPSRGEAPHKDGGASAEPIG